MRTGRDNYEVPKCCDNTVKSPTELNSPLNRCVQRYRDEDLIECQFSLCGCNFRATDRSQLIIHNEENIHRHMNVSVKIKCIECSIKFSFNTFTIMIFVLVSLHILDDDVVCDKNHHRKGHKIRIIAINDHKQK